MKKTRARLLAERMALDILKAYHSAAVREVGQAAAFEAAEGAIRDFVKDGPCMCEDPYGLDEQVEDE